MLDELVPEGVGVLMISSELPEVLGMADRILVVHEGRLVAEFAARGRRGFDHAGRDGAESGHGGMTLTAPPEMPADAMPGAQAASGVRRARLMLRAREVGILIALVVVFAVTTIKNPHFADRASIQQLLSGASLVALLAVGETLVIVTRNVDLSIGSVLGLSAYVVGLLFKSHPGTPVVVALLPAWRWAGGGGHQRRHHHRNQGAEPRGHPRHAVHRPGRRRQDRQREADRSDHHPEVVPGDRLQEPLPRRAVADGHRRRHRRGRRVLDAHVPRWPRPVRHRLEPDAAALAGVPSGKRVFIAFAISGGLAGLGGALFLAQFATVTATAGTGYELKVIAAVVVGGVAIFGGSGTVLGAALGALLLNTINQALVAAKVSAFWNLAIAGFLLLAAIAFDRFVSLRVNRALRVQGGARRAG